METGSTKCHLFALVSERDSVALVDDCTLNHGHVEQIVQLVVDGEARVVASFVVCWARQKTIFEMNTLGNLLTN